MSNQSLRQAVKDLPRLISEDETGFAVEVLDDKAVMVVCYDYDRPGSFGVDLNDGMGDMTVEYDLGQTRFADGDEFEENLATMIRQGYRFQDEIQIARRLSDEEDAA